MTLAADITSYQARVERWLEACFPPSVRSDRGERTHRFLEEALELVEAARVAAAAMTADLGVPFIARSVRRVGIGNNDGGAA
jgi:hypothetical protein